MGEEQEKGSKNSDEPIFWNGKEVKESQLEELQKKYKKLRGVTVKEVMPRVYRTVLKD